MFEKEVLIILIFVSMIMAYNKGGHHYKKKVRSRQEVKQAAPVDGRRAKLRFILHSGVGCSAGTQSTYPGPPGYSGSRPPGGPISADMMCALCLFYGWYDGIMRFCYSGRFIPPAYRYSRGGDDISSYYRGLSLPSYGHRYYGNGNYGNYGSHYHNHKFPKHKPKKKGYYS